MNDDKLKNFINQNKDQFDDFEPTDRWSIIEKALDTEKINIRSQQRSRLSNTFTWQIQVWKYAAAILLIAVIGMGYYIFIMPSNKNVVNLTTEKLSPELADAEYYYSSQIAEKQKVLKSSSLSNYCTSDLAVLDSNYIQLKQELFKDVNNQQITNAMIQNLQIRMKILNEQVEMLKVMKKYQNKQIKGKQL